MKNVDAWLARLGAARSSAFLVFGCLATALYALQLSPVVDAAAFLLLGLGTCAALVAAPWLNRLRLRTPWFLIAAASAAFLAGALLRPWAATQTGVLAGAADAFTVPGYLLLILALAKLLRARGSLERHAIADGLIICLGAGLLSLTQLALPAASISTRPRWVSALAGLYPVFDVVLVLALVNLAFTTSVRRRSYQLLMVAMACMLIGDVGYALIGARGQLVGPPLLDLPFLLAYTLLGAAALHPSIVDVGRALPRPVQAWSWRRLALLLPALAMPAILTVAIPQPSAGTRVVIAAAGAVMVAVLLLRAVSAVTAYARAQEVFRHQATHDPLTSLPNRGALVTEVSRLLAQRQRANAPVWLSFLDLDGFKLVNDSWGHDTGDRLITEVAGRICDAVPSTAIVARVGGDEFVVAHAARRAEAVDVAEAILAALTTPLRVRGADVVISASIGMASSTDAGTAEALLRDADTAMYRAKAQGRNRWVVFDDSMRQRVRDRVDIELALRHAVSSRALRLAYQPVVDLFSGELCGAEALLRWDHAVRGPISPVDFIPVAEDSGVISEIGLWVLDEALRQLSSWRGQGRVGDDFWVSVNVSAHQLRDHRVESAVRAGLAAYGLHGRELVLEITESAMLDPTEQTERTLLGLRGQGVRLAVDDFGTGYSALGYLRRHPVTAVKIDRGFVHGLGRDTEDEEIVRAVVAMSTALGLHVVAEGVETAAQRDVLASLGVRQAQGWLWAPAMAPQNFVRKWTWAAGAVDAS